MLISGLPGSGKTTLAKQLGDFYGIPYCEADKYFMVGEEYKFDPAKLGEAHATCIEQCEASLKEHGISVVSNTFTTEMSLKPYIDMAKRNDAYIMLIRMETQYEQTHAVPDYVVERMRQQLQELKYNPEVIVQDGCVKLRPSNINQ